MTALTLLAQLALVDILLLVTGDTGRRRLAFRFVGLVTGLTGDIEMLAAKTKIGLPVIKGGIVQMNDIGLTPLVFAMTVIALARLDAGNPAMKAFLLFDIGANQLVTVETELALALLVKTLVTLLAIILIFGMTADDIARQQDRIEDARLDIGRQQQQQDRQQARHQSGPAHQYMWTAMI